MTTGQRSGRFGVLAALLALLAVYVAAGPAAHAKPAAHAQRVVTTASYNVYLGADLQPLFGARDQVDLIQRAGQVYRSMEATDFPERATAIADLIAARGPEVVGLQEVALWERGPLNGELEVTYDFLETLLAELAARGTPYRAVASNPNFTGQLPVSFTEQARFTDSDVIIVRDDLKPSRLRTAGARSGTFAAKLTIPTAIPGLTFEVPRGWSAVDLTVRGKTFRFANTHLEAFGPPEIRTTQARELVEVLSDSPHPVVLAGDLNSRPSDTAGAYGVATAAGFADAWTASGGDPAGGWTSGQTDSLLDPNQLTHRIDYVLFEPQGVQALSAEVIGDEEADRSSPTGYWPADHAGVVATLKLGKP